MEEDDVKLISARERAGGRCGSHSQCEDRGQRLVQAATIAAFAYLCLGEFLLLKKSAIFSGTDWARQEVLLLVALSLLAVVLASTGGCSAHSFEPGAGGRPSTATLLLAALNIVPIVVVIVTSLGDSQDSDNCPYSAYKGAPSGKEVDCNYLTTLLDVVGVLSARLARFDLGASLLLATRGDSGWLLRATGGWLGLPEAVPLHRIAGWWCVGQSALHSTAYLVFYPLTGGLKSLWFNCFPTALPTSGAMNTLGLVNFFGIVAFVAMLPLALPSLPYLRRRSYHIFQRLHLPAAVLFVICCALHDLLILLFAVPGIADWYLGQQRSTKGTSAALPAKVRLLSGTSGPWVELTVTACSSPGTTALPKSAKGREGQPLAPRGEWALVRVLPVGREAHPLSVAVSSSDGGLSALVAAGAGDWSTSLATLARTMPSDSGHEVQVEVIGPFAVGGGDWSLVHERALLLVAGGTGVFGWLPALASADANATGGRLVHLVWCVKTEADYLALANRLPPRRAGVRVTIFITRATSSSLVVGDHTPAAPDVESNVTLTSDQLREEEVNAGLLSSTEEKYQEREWAALRSDSSRGSGPSKGGTSTLPVWDMWASLFATFCALTVGYWGWGYMTEDLLGSSSTLIGYALWKRSLPIALISASLVVATTLASRISFILSRRGHDHDGTSAAAPNTADGNGERAQHEGISLLALGADGEAGDHDVRAGRPDLAALVRTAAAAAAAAVAGGTAAPDPGWQRNASRRLVVAACGPAELVEAARNAVESVRKEGGHLELRFSGTDSRW